MKQLLKTGYRAKKRPSGHDISKNFSTDNGASIPPNLIGIANTESNSAYLRYCRQHGLKPNPARFPAELPEYFVRMLTEEGDLVLDPFAGSCVTGAVSERLSRRWICVEMMREYVEGAKARFIGPAEQRKSLSPDDQSNYYRVARPDILWNGKPSEPLDIDGGRKRLKK